MVHRFGRLQGYVAKRLTEHVHLDQRALDNLRARGEQGTVVYVLRHRSLLDYLLLNWIMLREGLPLARFANGVSSRWFVTLGEMFRRLVRRLQRPLSDGLGRGLAERREIAELVEAGEPVLVFLRARHPRLLWNSRSRLAAARPGRELLQEIVARAGDLVRPVYLVPICFSRGRRFRRQGSRLSALAYSVHDAPSDLKKLLTYRLNREDLLLAIGRTIDLDKFLSANRALGVGRAARRLTNSLQRELAQEERAVWGPLLQSRHVMAERVFEGREVAMRIEEIARERGISARRSWREARGYFDEMAANFHGFYFAIIEFFFNRIWQRVFRASSARPRARRRVRQAAPGRAGAVPPQPLRLPDPVVHLPRATTSRRRTSPPASTCRSGRWAPLFRGAGAYFIRRTFEGNALYKVVFRTLPRVPHPRGLHAGVLHRGRAQPHRQDPHAEARHAVGDRQRVRRRACGATSTSCRSRSTTAASSRRRPTSASCCGGEKETESFGALLTARQRAAAEARHGLRHLRRADLARRRRSATAQERFRAERATRTIEEEKRRFIQKLGFRLLREVNEVGGRRRDVGVVDRAARPAAARRAAIDEFVDSAARR